MKAREIIESGLLEIYALGQLEGEDLKLVELAIKKYATVRTELKSIESALAKYAGLHRVPVSDHILDNTLNQLSGKIPAVDPLTESTKSSGPWKTIAIVSGIAASALLFHAFHQNSEYQELESEHQNALADCDEIRRVYDNQSNLFAALTDKNNNPIEIDATEKYPDTRLIMHTNTSIERNYLQIQNLPAIADGFSFQLWSLKSDVAPIPLNVFNAGQERLLPVDYIENSNAYAITIELDGGATTPNLDELIGVFSLG